MCFQEKGDILYMTADKHDDSQAIGIQTMELDVSNIGQRMVLPRLNLTYLLASLGALFNLQKNNRFPIRKAQRQEATTLQRSSRSIRRSRKSDTLRPCLFSQFFFLETQRPAC